MSWVLGIDTSIDVRVGLARDGVVVARRHVADTRQHVERLIPLVQAVLGDAGVRVADLDLICVGLGPGPFTGLRVGIVAAQTLAVATGVPLHGVCSLDVLAADVTDISDYVVATDARRKEVYWARYRTGDPLPTRLDGPQVGAPEDLPDLPVVGPGVVAYADRLGERPRPVGADILDAGRLAALGAVLPSAGTQPLYLRRPDAAPPAKPKSTLVRPLRRRRRRT